MKYFLAVIGILALTIFLGKVYAIDDQFQVSTKLYFPKTIHPEEKKDFSITVMNIKSALYVQNMTAVFDVSPKSASQYVSIEAKSIEKLLWAGSADTIHGTIHVDRDIPAEKIFIAVSFEGIGDHDTPIFSVGQTDTVWITIDNDNASRTNGGSVSPDKTVYPVPWGKKYPLKQIKSGVALVDVQCNDGKYPAIRHDRMRVACVSLDTESSLIMRGWATMRLAMPGDNISEALCNNYGGKWHQEHNGCRDISDFQCSLIGGKFVDDLKICSNEICPKRGYTICVAEPKLDWKTINHDSPMIPLVFQVPKDEKMFDVEYGINGGMIKDMTFSNHTNSMLVEIDSAGKGDLVLSIPRNLLDAKMDYCPPRLANPSDDRFFVLLDGKEIWYDEVLTTSEIRVLQLKFAENSTKLEIIGTCLI